MVELPVTAAQLMGSARQAFELPMNVARKRSKTRASSIGSCARQQAYNMAATPVTNPSKDGSELTAEQGRIIDAEITQKLFIPHGLIVANSQIELPPDFPMTGHPDGELRQMIISDWDARPTLKDGLKWGYEHKHLGRWAYETVFKLGFEQGEPGYLCQTVSYGMALDWDAAYIVCLAQDASSTNSDARTNLKAAKPQVRWANQPGWDAKMLTYGVDLRPYYDTLGKRLLDRAEWLTSWAEQDGDPENVAREADPDIMTRDEYAVSDTGDIERLKGSPFPCGWCPWLEQCRAAGQCGERAPELPFKLMKEMD